MTHKTRCVWSFVEVFASESFMEYVKWKKGKILG